MVIFYALIIGLAIRVVWMGLIIKHVSEPSDVQSAFIDLGLSVLWSSCNVGAKNPWESGDHYTWDEAKKKGLKMPTADEFEELLTKCQWSDWITDYEGHIGVNGYVVSGNGNSIFLPATGWKKSGGTLRYVGSYGLYWSSSLYSGDTDDARHLNFNYDRRFVHWYDRNYGFSVRAVRHRN